MVPAVDSARGMPDTHEVAGERIYVSFVCPNVRILLMPLQIWIGSVGGIYRGSNPVRCLCNEYTRSVLDSLISV